MGLPLVRFALLIPPLLTTGCATPRAGSSVAAIPELSHRDGGITEAVEAELLFDRAVPFDRIDVSTNDGIVTLSGEVDNLVAKTQARRLAETVKGVRSVIDRVTVVPPRARTDTMLQRDCANALAFDGTTASWRIDVEATDGRVTLRGSVGSHQARQLAEKVVGRVAGVVTVDNRLTVADAASRSDTQIESEVRARLRWNALIDAGMIEVEVDDGVVRLSGVVGSAAEKARARFVAWSKGVESVDTTELAVEPWARNELQKTVVDFLRTDDAVAEAIRDALTLDPRVERFGIDVTVDDGIVTLRGIVDNLRAKRSAEADARNTVGVHRVRNRIKVRSDAVADVELADQIRNALLHDPLTEHFEVGVDSVAGEVYLRGHVDSYLEKGRAEQLASSTRGVARVHHYLEVHYAGPLAYNPYVHDQYPYGHEWYDYVPPHTSRSDTEIRARIESQLMWSPFVDADDVVVEVEDGVAKLIGVVDSPTEHSAAIENAYEGGAIWVDDDLRIE